MNIFGKIIGIKYNVIFSNELQLIDIKDFDINLMPSSCLLNLNKHSIALSKWVSPKRTRSYPFERVYNTLNISKKITIIPIVKDEGADGDRDFIQWDTISLMSLLDVYVVYAYYHKAKKSNNKITKQQFDNKYILSKIKEIEQYHSSALHWNLNEVNTNLHAILDKANKSYLNIEKITGVKLHNFNGLDNFKEKIGKDVSLFMNFSREKAEKAQSREFKTIQPKESLSTYSKAKITITNYLGGQYFLTADEIDVNEDKLFLIESKHSKCNLLPSKGDIKDGLLKMILYSNLTDVKLENNCVLCTPILRLTSSKIEGTISSDNLAESINSFYSANNFNNKQKLLLNTIFEEARINNFKIEVKYSK